jgi:hypothetical protein
MQDTEQVDLDRRSAGAVVAALSFSTRRIVRVGFQTDLVDEQQQFRANREPSASHVH